MPMQVVFQTICNSQMIPLSNQYYNIALPIQPIQSDTIRILHHQHNQQQQLTLWLQLPPQLHPTMISNKQHYQHKHKHNHDLGWWKILSNLILQLRQCQVAPLLHPLLQARLLHWKRKAAVFGHFCSIAVNIENSQEIIHHHQILPCQHLWMVQPKPIAEKE